MTNMLLEKRISIRGYKEVLGRTLDCTILLFNSGLALDGVMSYSLVW